MLGSTILDVAIGVVFVCLLASLIASAIREGIEARMKTRASYLEAGLRELLKDPQGTGLVSHFYNHPLIYSLYSGDYDAAPASRTRLLFKGGNNLPSYIPTRNFALALMDMAARGPQVNAGIGANASVAMTVDEIRANLGTLESPAVERVLLIALDGANGDPQKAQAYLESWYDSAMDRVSGGYKRSTQTILIVIGLLLAVALNINILSIGADLYHDKTARELIVESAKVTAADAANKPVSYDTAEKKLNSLNLRIGWSQGLGGFRANWSSDLAGWILTAFAVSMGAPFWFDWLNKLIVVRSTVKPHQKSPEEASSDRKPDATKTKSVVSAATLPAIPAPLQAAPPAPPLPVDEDGCDVDMTSQITLDEDLPVAVGGVC